MHELATHAVEAAKNAIDPTRSLREVTDDIANRGWQSAERFIATGRVEFRRSSAYDVDAHRAAVRSKIGAVADVPALTGPRRAIATAFRDYDRLPHAVRGALDAALDATLDPLTYATFGRDAMERAGLSALDFIERRVAPRIVDLFRTHSLTHPNFAVPHGSIDSGQFVRNAPARNLAMARQRSEELSDAFDTIRLR